MAPRPKPAAPEPVEPATPTLAGLPEDDDDVESGEGELEDDEDESGEGEPEDDDDEDDEPTAHLAAVMPTTLPEMPTEPLPPRRGRPPIPRQVDDGPDRVQRPAPRNPRGLQGPRNLSPEARASSPVFRQAQRNQEEAIAELDALLAGLNFKKREYEIRVKRLAPDVDENGTPCAGMLNTYHEKVTTQQIQARYGGGTFEVTVFGPHPSTSQPSIIKRDTFTIAGHPKPMPSFAKNNRDDESSTIADALRVVAEANQHANDRIADMMERTQNQSPLKDLAPVFEKMMKKTDDTVTMLMKQMEMDNARREQERRDFEAKEERRREEARREEDRRRQEEEKRAEAREARLREEREMERRREDQRREDERERREEERRLKEEERRAEEKREEKRDAERRERERELREEARKQAEAEREARREEAAERQRQHERDLLAAENRAKQEADRMREYMTLTQNNSNQMLDFMTARMEGGGLESIAKQIEFLETIRGDNKEPTKIEQLTEGVSSFTQALMPVAQQFMGRGQQQGGMVGGQPGQQQQQQPQGRRVLVDVPQRPALTAPVAQQPTVANPAPVEPATPAPVVHDPSEIKNDFTSFVMPNATTDPSTVGIVLIKNLDLAVQKNMSAEDIVDKVLDPFEDAIEGAPWAEIALAAFQNMSDEQLLQHIANEVVDANTKQPLSHWAILSPLGSERVVAAFQLWKQAGEDDEGVPLD